MGACGGTQRTSTSAPLPQNPRIHGSQYSTKKSASLDRPKVSDCNTVYILAFMVWSLGDEVSELTISRSSIRSNQIKHCEHIFATIKEKFSPMAPFLIHWDCKTMTDVTVKGVIDSLPILLSGGDATRSSGSQTTIWHWKVESGGCQ